mmetsp:Transcript_30846/g.66391  ORF Transcript_30846/g.66391 Transcript_30846/m.66391 type:complete len:254 (+) Transcript_30846:339-1100(+)
MLDQLFAPREFSGRPWSAILLFVLVLVLLLVLPLLCVGSSNGVVSACAVVAGIGGGSALPRLLCCRDGGGQGLHDLGSRGTRHAHIAEGPRDGQNLSGAAFVQFRKQPFTKHHGHLHRQTADDVEALHRLQNVGAMRVIELLLPHICDPHLVQDPDLLPTALPFVKPRTWGEAPNGAVPSAHQDTREDRNAGEVPILQSGQRNQGGVGLDGSNLMSHSGLGKLAANLFEVANDLFSGKALQSAESQQQMLQRH